MRVHHLNCGTMLLPSAHLVCHVLLIETDNSLVLVDSGYGLDDIADPRHRVGPARLFVRPVFKREETAAHQIERLGFHRADVRHIVLTHFDADHIGGLSDFPHAQVHVTAAEALGSMTSPSWREKNRYRSAQWAHGPTIVDGRTRVPAALRLMETLVAYDLNKVRDNHARLAELHLRADPDLAIINAHDPTLYEKARAGA